MKIADGWILLDRFGSRKEWGVTVNTIRRMNYAVGIRRYRFTRTFTRIGYDVRRYSPMAMYRIAERLK